MNTAVVRSDRDRGRPPKARMRGDATLVAHLGPIQAQLAEKRVVVLGSAPLEYRLEIDRPQHGLVVVNGSISTLKLTPDVWVVNARRKPEAGWNRHRLMLNAAMQKQAAGRHVGTLVLLPQGLPGDSEGTLERFTKQNTTWDRVVDVSLALRERIVFDVCGFDRHATKVGVSAGMFAACLAAWCKAREIELNGFSYQAGYAYLPPDVVPINARGHVRGDKVAVKAMLERGIHLHGDTVTRRRQERVQ